MWDYTDILYKDGITDIIIVKRGSLTNQLFTFMFEFRPIYYQSKITERFNIKVVTEINCFQK